MGQAVRALETQRDRLHLQMYGDVSDVTRAEVLEKGLRGKVNREL